MTSTNYFVKLSAKDILDISINLRHAGHCRPKEIQRVIRGLDTINFWKATEIRTFLLKTGPVVMYGKLPSEAYNHFLLLHCAITICSCTHFLKHLDVAKSILFEFVSTYTDIYGKGTITYNVHSLLHLVDDAKHFGMVDSFSSFPFESKLGQIKNLLSGGYKPLQQVARRLSEMCSASFSNESTQSNVLLKKLTTEKHLMPNCTGVYHELIYKGVCINSRDNNRWILTKDRTILKLINITKMNNVSVLYASELQNLTDFYTKPIKSSVLFIYCSDMIELPPKIYPISDILCKMFYINGSENKHTFIPVLHTIDLF